MSKRKSYGYIINGGILLGLMFPLMAWGLDIWWQDLPLALASIAKLHLQNPLHFMIDSAPLVLGGVAYYLWRIVVKTERKNRRSFRKQQQTLHKVIDFTEKLGKGNYTAEMELDAEQTDLISMLEGMRQRLITSHQEEKDRQWHATGIADIGNLLREHDTIEKVTYAVIKYTVDYAGLVQGAFFLHDQDVLTMKARYAYGRQKYQFNAFRIGQGLVGQCAYERDTVYRREIPDDFASITSGLIEDKKPSEVLLVPLVSDDKLYGVFEFASVMPISPTTIAFVELVGEITGRTIHNLATNAHTAQLLTESQQMSAELQLQQRELEKNAEEMRQAKEDLEVSNTNLEWQIREVENQQKKLQSLLSKSSEIITIYDVQHKVKYKSPSVQTILGYSPEELIGKNDLKKLAISGYEKVEEAFAQVIEQPEESVTVAFEVAKKGGGKVWLEAQLTNLLHDPAIEGVVMNAYDITERRKAEKEQEMRAKMQALSENSQDIIIRFDLQGTFLYVNPRLSYYTGIQTKFTGAISSGVGIDPTVVQHWATIISSVYEQRTLIQREMPFTSKAGNFIMQVNAIPEYDKDNEVETVLMVLHDITERKKQEIEIQETNQKITESINYARRIQHAIIPMEEHLRAQFADFMMFYKPKDVVSGDFPWYYKKDDIIYIAAVDCTGHGVPGAMMSLIGCLLLNDIINDDEDHQTSDILARLHQSVVQTLKQDVEGNNTSDGMDVALCKIDLLNGKIGFSGAHRPLYLLRNGEILEYKGSPFPIGGMQYRGRNKYKNHVIDLQKGDSIFFFSDGLPDQFGDNGEDKYSPQRIRDLIVQHQDKSMKELEDIFKNDLIAWMGSEKQLDDVLLMGISF